MPTTTILMLDSSPSELSHLQTAREFNAIDACLRAGSSAKDVDFRMIPAVTANEVQVHLVRYRPQILHFSGHGNENGELLFQDSSGYACPADKHAFAALFVRLTGPLRCVVLNACHTAAQAELIAQHIDVVIGMSREIEDEIAVLFATNFYQGLSEGLDIQSAFDMGIKALGLSDGNSPRIPTLYHRADVEPGRVFLHREFDKVARNEIIRVLSRLFLRLFQPEELRNRVAMLPKGGLLAAQLPGNIATADNLAVGAAGVLADRMALRQAWFDDLAEDIPSCRTLVNEAARKWSAWEQWGLAQAQAE